MAFTYNDFEKRARENGLYESFSEADLNLARQNPDVGMSLISYKNDFRNATTDDARALANSGANGLRTSYGDYSGGASGSGFYKQEKSPSDFSGSHKQDMDILLGKVQGSGFQWDAETDPAYSSYKKQYVREGERATQNAMGSAAAMTGGIPSTAAMTAGAQAGQYYASKLADKVPELRSQRYNEYMQEKSADLAILDAMRQMDNTEYGRFGDDLTFDKNKEQTAYDREQTEWEKQQYDKEQERKRLETVALEMAAAGDYSLYQQLYPEVDKDRLEQIWGIQYPKLAYGLNVPKMQAFSVGGNKEYKNNIDVDTKNTPLAPDSVKNTPIVPDGMKTTPLVPDSMKTTITLGDARKMYQEAVKAEISPQQMLAGLNDAKKSGAYTEADYRLMLEVFTNPGRR